jgi:predicted ArsR family transcriptional regulator
MNLDPRSEPARSRDRILELFLKSEGPLNIQAVSKALGISRNATHQHVAAMEREGLVERGSAVPTGGRPSRGFRLSAAGKATFPRQYSLLAKQLLAELSQYLGADELNGAMQRIGRSLADSLSSSVGRDADEALIAGLMR